MTRFAILASGSGSNAEALMKAAEAGIIPAEAALVVTDKPNAGVCERAARYGVPVAAFQPKTYETKAAFEEAVVHELKQRDVDWLFLAGYMRIAGEVLLTAYPGRMVNIHPSLLPAFPGKDAIGQAVAHGVKVSGATVHFVDAGIDTGPIIAQTPVPIDEGDTLTDVTARIQQAEHELYPKTAAQLIQEERKRVGV
ncbi:formyltetrahydrofolate-dependent phosphoribosylglycinamide formyltransferase [Salsuginibacillus halophilus]|uniref:Phosphoribosylglycinamide formyltransferase n=1 Tax=Salsuginibacillus halophilus TaxID=517424 RepID=A0A2P8HLD7_9BACI|nr:phosphoribosylglycinamide formyltransferase [Salsuginibacillus halophilus]PSL47042.1 formyltetrahydrofolate-dependent phosphoribosylglycinamide formyltransferase [Salsuginibacillus halophilus]